MCIKNNFRIYILVLLKIAIVGLVSIRNWVWIFRGCVLSSNSNIFSHSIFLKTTLNELKIRAIIWCNAKENMFFLKSFYVLVMAFNIMSVVKIFHILKFNECVSCSLIAFLFQMASFKQLLNHVGVMEFWIYLHFEGNRIQSSRC